MTGLSIRGLTVRRDRRTVLEDVSFTAPAGAVTALLGLAGAGKTSLLAAIAGLLPAERGAIFHGTSDITRMSARRRGMAFLAPGTMLPESRALQKLLRGFAGSGGASLADERIDQFGLAPLAKRPAGLLSHGETLLTMTAARLVRAGGISLVDEAGMGLDRPAEEALSAILAHEAASGRVVLLATRAPGTALRADHLVLLSGGRVLQAGTPASLYAEPACEAAAQLTGPANILRGHVRELRPGGFLWTGGGRYAQSAGAETKRPVLGSPVTLCLRPERVGFLSEGQTADNTTEAEVTDVRSAGALLDIRAQTALGMLRIAAPSWPLGYPAVGQRGRVGWGVGAASVLG